jgi:uncharacterized protein
MNYGSCQQPLVTPAQAASFDCSKAQSTVEYLICDNQTISKIGNELSKAHKDVKQHA